MKIDTFQRFVGFRHDLRGEQFTRALNEVFVVFQDSPEVVMSLRSFHEAVLSKSGNITNDLLVSLFKTMAKHIGFNPSLFNDSMFLKPFNTKQYSTPDP